MLYVYSSGSVEAQKLLFAHTEYGDLTPLFSGYYDTRIGHKREVASYERIRDDLGLAGNAILFLSDIREELDAAAKAGMKTVCLARDGMPAEDIGHPVVSDFSQIDLESL
jgi:enolase-phosphatase E1